MMWFAVCGGKTDRGYIFGSLFSTALGSCNLSFTAVRITLDRQTLDHTYPTDEIPISPGGHLVPSLLPFLARNVQFLRCTLSLYEVKDRKAPSLSPIRGPPLAFVNLTSWKGHMYHTMFQPVRQREQEYASAFIPQKEAVVFAADVQSLAGKQRGTTGSKSAFH